MLEPRSSKEANFWIFNSHVWRLQYHHSKSVYGITQDVFFSSGIFLTTTTYYKTYYENSFKMKNHQQFQTQNSMLLTTNATFCAIVYVTKELYHNISIIRHETHSILVQFLVQKTKISFSGNQNKHRIFGVFWHRIGLNRAGVMWNNWDSMIQSHLTNFFTLLRLVLWSLLSFDTIKGQKNSKCNSIFVIHSL